MNYWLDTVETIPDGVGFRMYGGVHLSWLALFAVLLAASCLLYRRLPAHGRTRMRWVMAALIVADELFKMTFLWIGGNYTAEYLPLHLCSINILLIAWHAVRRNETLDHFLYTVGIPGALLALFFPSWVELPPQNLMHIHSFTVHILLAIYPIMLLAGGEIKLDVRRIPKVLGLLAVFAVIALIVNLLFDTNFMFLMSAESGNPLALFEDWLGSHLWGFVVLLPLVILLMYTPVWVRKIIKRT